MLARARAFAPEDATRPSIRLAASGDDPAPARLRIAVHVASYGGVSSSGTFVATGLVADSGVVPDLERFASLRERPRAPLVVRGAEVLAGSAGRIAIAYDGVFRRVGPGVYAGEGAWRVTGGDHAYERLRCEGSWTATTVIGPDGVTADVVYEGPGKLR
jgi:hypothetical protein